MYVAAMLVSRSSALALGLMAVGFTAPISRSQWPASPRVPDPIALTVVYPAPTDLVRVRDSSFLFGSVANGRVRVTVNGSPARVWPNGAWLAWVSFPADTLIRFRIEARLGTDSVLLDYPVRRDPQYLPGVVSNGSVWIDSMALSPRGQLWLPASEYVAFSARAADGSRVRLHLPGGEIVPLLPQEQPGDVLP